MGEIRRVDNRYARALEPKDLSIFEGTNSVVVGNILAAYARENGRILKIHEPIAEWLSEKLFDDAPAGALYTLGRKATLYAAASFLWDRNEAEFAHVRFWKTPEAERVETNDELNFLRAIHDDVREGIRPVSRQYGKPIYTTVSPDNLSRRALYISVGYKNSGRTDDGTENRLVIQ